MDRRLALLPFAVLAAGVVIVSTAAILIRVAQQEGVPSITIAAGRLGLAALILVPLALARAGPELRSLSRRDWLLAIASGACLAVHFAAWIASLAYTSVASSVALVTTNPVWVGLASWLLLRERIAPVTIAGIALSIGGTLLIFAADANPGDAPRHAQAFLGNGLALVGAVTVSAYLLIGRGLRARLSLLPYVAVVYASAAIILVVWMLAAGHSLAGLSSLAWAMLVALALGPQLLGHTAFNWALRHVSATFIAVSILGEPIGSSLLAWAVFDERFTPLQLAGFAALLAGIVVAARGERRAGSGRQSGKA